MKPDAGIAQDAPLYLGVYEATLPLQFVKVHFVIGLSHHSPIFSR